MRFEREDAITGPGGWKLTSRATNYMDSTSTRGYDPVHTRPWELIPNGIVATIDAQPGARAEVRTSSGNFSFVIADLKLGRTVPFLTSRAGARTCLTRCVRGMCTPPRTTSSWMFASVII